MSYRISKKHFTVAGILLVIIGISAFFSIENISKMFAHDVKKQARILFEIKVIDESGRPVQGATVEKDHFTVGMTDSFGEWRRYLQTESGSILSLNISKQVGNQIWKTSKKYSIPSVTQNYFATDDKELRNFEVKSSLKAVKVEVVAKSTTRARLISTK